MCSMETLYINYKITSCPAFCMNILDSMPSVKLLIHGKLRNPIQYIEKIHIPPFVFTHI